MPSLLWAIRRHPRLLQCQKSEIADGTHPNHPLHLDEVEINVHGAGWLVQSQISDVLLSHGLVLLCFLISSCPWCMSSKRLSFYYQNCLHSEPLQSPHRDVGLDATRYVTYPHGQCTNCSYPTWSLSNLDWFWTSCVKLDTVPQVSLCELSHQKDALHAL